MKAPEHWTLSNGIRVIHMQVSGNVAHCGLFINAGTRDEMKHENGLAHFIEHAVFKGTSRRKTYHILARMEDVGGEINAYTSKEETCLYSSFLPEFYLRAIDLLSDIAFHSVFPEKEINKEKTVIIDEINSYKDSPSEEIYDRFEEIIFPNHPLGKDILGTEKNLLRFKPADLREFIARTYNTDEIVFSSVGDISSKKLRDMLSLTLEKIPKNLRGFKRAPVGDYKPIHKILKRKTSQTHLVMGNRAYSSGDSNRTGLFLLNNLLGGPGMSSRLNLAIREKYGFTYNIESSYLPYSDTGLWTVYMGTENEWIDRCRELLFKELDKLKQKPLGSLQLHKAKQQLIGQIAISQESRLSLMLSMAKSFLLYNKIEPFERTVQKIEALKSSDLLEIANEIFDEKILSSLIYQSSGKQKSKTSPT